MTLKDKLAKIEAAQRAKKAATEKPSIKDNSGSSGQDQSGALTNTFPRGAAAAPAPVATEVPKPKAEDSLDGLFTDGLPSANEAADSLGSKTSPEPSLEMPPTAKPLREPTVMGKTRPDTMPEPSVDDLSLSDQDVFSVESVGMATGTDKVSEPERGVYDQTVASNRLPPPPPQPREPPPIVLEQSAVKKTPIQKFIEATNASSASPKEKAKALRLKREDEIRKFKEGLNRDLSEEELNAFLAQCKSIPPAHRNLLQQHAADIEALKDEKERHDMEAVNEEIMHGRLNGNAEPAPAEPAERSGADTADLGPKAAEAVARADAEARFDDERPEQFSPRPQQPRDGFLKGMLRSPMTYFATGIAACTGILVYRDAVSGDGFQTFADAANHLINDVMEMGPVEVSRHYATAAFAGIFLLIGGFTEGFRRRKASKEAQMIKVQEEELAKGDYLKMSSYLIREFRRILGENRTLSAQKMELTGELSENEELLLYATIFNKDDYKMQTIFDAVNMPQEIAQHFTGELKVAESILLATLYLHKLGGNLNDVARRRKLFRKFYANSELFRMKLPEIFTPGKDGGPSELYKRLLPLKYDGESEPQVMTTLLEALYHDYQLILAEERAALRKE